MVADKAISTTCTSINKLPECVCLLFQIAFLMFQLIVQIRTCHAARLMHILHIQLILSIDA